MLRIAICDDDNSAVAAHKKIAETCLMQSSSAGEIVGYRPVGICFMILQKMVFSLT